MVVLGSTGSIGCNTLKIAKKFKINIEVLVAGKNIALLNKQIKEFKPKIVVVSSFKYVKDVKSCQIVLHSKEGIEEALRRSESKLVINALVGFFGLSPSLLSIKLGKDLALANKESLVVAGQFMDVTKLRPIDSEHFGLKYLINDKTVKKMLITASGGAFRDINLNKLKSVSFKNALKHPNWSMGDKITIDSATMTNKLFELVEAKYLFAPKKMDALIETKSLIHALINFKDGSTTAHIANPCMTLPISYAILNKPNKKIIKSVDLLKVKSLRFKKIKVSRYPIWEIKDDLLSKPHLGLVLNASNEINVELFKKGLISFLDISKNNIRAFKHFYKSKARDMADIYSIDKEVRKFSLKH